MDASRDEILVVLACMGVELTPTTKLPLVALQRRLTKALDCTQSVIKSKEVDPSAFPLWSSTSRDSLEKASQVISMQEAFQGSGLLAQQPLYENAFLDLRQTVVGFGHHWDEGYRHIIVEDMDGSYGVTLRVCDFYLCDIMVY